jgi:Integrase core domain
MVITFALMLAAALSCHFGGRARSCRSALLGPETRLDPLPNSGGGRSAQTAAQTTDGKDGLLGKFASQRSVAAHLTAEANGIVERFFRSLKEECVWQHNFSDFTEARAAITKWIHWYNAERPHQALGYRSPRQFRGLQPKLVA